MPIEKYRAPTIYPRVDPVSLDDFDIDDIRSYLRNNHDEDTPSDGDFVVSESQMNRLDTLILCGQHQHAINELLDMASAFLGRSFKPEGKS